MSNRFDPLLFGTDIPDPAVPYGVGDDGEYDADPMALDIAAQNTRLHRESFHRVWLQVGALLVFGFTLIFASLHSAGVIH